MDGVGRIGALRNMLQQIFCDGYLIECRCCAHHRDAGYYLDNISEM